MTFIPTPLPWAEESLWLKIGHIPPASQPQNVTVKLEYEDITRFIGTWIWAVLSPAGERVGQLKLMTYSWEWRTLNEAPPGTLWRLEDKHGLGKIWLNGHEHFLAADEMVFIFNPAKTEQALAEIMRLYGWTILPNTQPTPPSGTAPL